MLAEEPELSGAGEMCGGERGAERFRALLLITGGFFYREDRSHTAGAADFRVALAMASA